MTKIDTEKTIKFLAEKWKGKTCPMCQNGKWSVSSEVFELREFTGGGLIIGGNSSIIPIIPITCSNCGNIVHINAILAGLIDNDGKSRQ